MKILGPHDVDGVLGPQTEQVVKDFQQSNGLVVDGVIGPITRSHVPARQSPTLQAGSLGPVVAMLQGVLETGFGYAGEIDGIIGPVAGAERVSTRVTPGSGIMDERAWMAPEAPRQQRSRAFRV